MPELTDEQKAMCDISYLTKRKKERNDQPERILQRNICDYLQTHYPDVYFMSDPSGIKLAPNILKLLKSTRSRHSQLDIVILEPSDPYKALFLEVKANTPFKLDGGLKTDEHLAEQWVVMKELISKGYACHFVWSIEQAVNMVRGYLGAPVRDTTPLFP